MEAPPVRQLDEPEPRSALDDDVEPAVVHPLDDLDHGRGRADLADTVVVGVDETELAVEFEAFADQLAVARLEDVERDLLGREQHDAEREQADLVHGRSVDRGSDRLNYARRVETATRPLRAPLRRVTFACACAVACCLLTSWPTPAAASDGPPEHVRVTLLADSVGGVLWWFAPAREELARGLDLRLEVRTCMRLARAGCLYDGERSPSALETLARLGSEVGQMLVVDVGYNDTAVGYADGIDRLMEAAVANGVREVIWTTLSTHRAPYPDLNAAIGLAAERWPQLVIADWAAESRGRSWFSDDVHLTARGGVALARFLRPIVLDACGASCRPVTVEPEPRPVTARAEDGSFRIVSAANVVRGGAGVEVALTLGRASRGRRCSLHSYRRSSHSGCRGSDLRPRRASDGHVPRPHQACRPTRAVAIGISCGAASARLPLTVGVPRVTSIEVEPFAPGATSIPLWIRLSGPAGPHGVSVRLASTAGVAVPPVVVVAPGSRELRVIVAAETVDQPLAAAIEATAPAADLVARIQLAP